MSFNRLLCASKERLKSESNAIQDISVKNLSDPPSLSSGEVDDDIIGVVKINANLTDAKRDVPTAKKVKNESRNKNIDSSWSVKSSQSCTKNLIFKDEDLSILETTQTMLKPEKSKISRPSRFT